MSKKYILTVDDDEFWRNRMKEELSKLGCELLVTHSPGKAMNFFRKFESEIALVVSDNQMRVGDRMFQDAGIDLLCEIHLSAVLPQDVPFLLFTSEASNSQRKQVTEHGGFLLLKERSVIGALATKAKELIAA